MTETSADGQGGGDVATRLESMLARLHRLALVLAGNQTSARQLVQTTCRRFLAAADGLPGGEDFEHMALADLCAVWNWEVRAGNIAVSTPGDSDAMQAAFAGLDATDDTAVVSETRFHQEANLSETRFQKEAVWEFLQAMPPQQRAALLLIYGEGYSYHEAAQLLDLSVEVVMSAVVGARAALIEESGAMPPERYEKKPRTVERRVVR